MPALPREVKRMHEPILVINAGSSSIKFSVFETGADRSLSPAAHGEVQGIGTASRLSVTDPQGRNLAERPVAGDDYESAIATIHNYCAVHIGEAKFRRHRSSGCPWRFGVFATSANRRASCRGSGGTGAARSVASTAPHRRDPRRRLGCTRGTAGCLFRYGLSPNATGARPALRPAARAGGEGRAPLWVPRPLLRIHCLGIAADRTR